jgi:hypothetical protein
MLSIAWAIKKQTQKNFEKRQWILRTGNDIDERIPLGFYLIVTFVVVSHIVPISGRKCRYIRPCGYAGYA